MSYVAKHDTVANMKKQISKLVAAFKRKQQQERKSASTYRSNELIRDQWAIWAEIQILDMWITRDTDKKYETSPPWKD